jgi:hypothetical protein
MSSPVTVNTMAPFPATYSFHGLFRMRVAHRGLARMMQDEFRFFLDTSASPDDPVDLVVEEGKVPLPSRMLSVQYSFDSGVAVIQTGSGRLAITDGHIIAEPQIDVDELYVRWAEGLMFFRALERGAFLAHSSAVCRDGVGILFPAWAHTGKTNVALEFVSAGYDYMADDWCLVGSAGEILGYPRWLNLFSYNFEAHPDIRGSIANRKERRNIARRLALTRFARSLATGSPLSTGMKYRIESRFFVHSRAPVEAVVPGSRSAIRAPLTKACLLSTTRSGRVDAEEISPNELARRVALTALYERNDYNLDRTAMHYAGLPDGPLDFAAAGAEVLGDAFKHARCLEVQIPFSPTKDDLRAIVSLVEAA